MKSSDGTKADEVATSVCILEGLSPSRSASAGSEMVAGHVPISTWWGTAAFTAGEAAALRRLSWTGSFMVIAPFITYHVQKRDSLYRFPCSLSHTIRLPGLARWLYAASYTVFLAQMGLVAYARRAKGMGITRILCPSRCLPSTNTLFAFN